MRTEALLAERQTEAMSVGHPHKTPNLLVPSEQALAMLHRLLTTGGAPALMRRFQHVDLDHDIVYTAGYNVAGTIRYADRDFVGALHDPQYATKILGAPIDTGMSPEDTLDCVMHHEAVEKVILDADNPVDFYDHVDEPGGFGAHEYATAAEHQMVKAKGGTPVKYERGLAGIIKYCESKQLVHVPHDYACAPLLDDPDAREKKILKRLQQLGVTDAFKVSKEGVRYSRSTGDRCSACGNWQGDRKAQLALCAVVDGLVRTDRWCTKFETMEGTHESEEDNAADAQAGPGEAGESAGEAQSRGAGAA